MYIVATSIKSEEESYFFIRHIQRVFVSEQGKTCIVGCNNNGYIEVKEKIQDILKQLKK